MIKPETVYGTGYTHDVMKEDEIRGLVSSALEQNELDGKRVLVIIIGE